MAKVNVSLYGEGLTVGLGDAITGLYTTNESAPLQAGAGLRQSYEFGLYSYCGYTTDVLGTCTNHTTARRYEPYDAITSDMRANYSQLTNFIIQGTTFKDSKYLGSNSKSAYYLLLLGTICTALALFTGVIKHTVAFLISACFAILGTIFLLAGSAIWTVIVHKSQDINTIIIGEPTAVSLGITVSTGTGIYLMWAAFACLFVSLIPYVSSCCTYRG